MSTNRTRKRRPPRGLRLSPEATAAWEACDESALRCALRLPPWEASPLPLEVTSAGVSEADPPRATNTLHDKSYDRALKLQQLLLAAAGWPDCKTAYQENLREAESWRDYCKELIAHPEYGGRGTGCDPASRAEQLQDAEDRVAYRQELLDTLDEVRAVYQPRC
jgi:hypothetical protein